MTRQALWLAMAAAVAIATPATAQLKTDAQRAYDEFQKQAPHRAFVIGTDGKGYWWAGASGPDPGQAVASAFKLCDERSEAKCSLYAINNVVLNGKEWHASAPPLLPSIGRLRPEPYWINSGPQAAAGLIVWSHGYMAGHDSTDSAPQGEVAYFTHHGYDLYRFDRQWVRDWPGDARALADAARQAKAMGYRRVILAGQSAGAWISLAAIVRGAPVDGVISVSAAHHGEVKNMRDVSRARWDWQQLVHDIKPGPRLVVVNFKDDTYDVGGRMDDARAAFAASGVDAIVISNPEGFRGHHAAKGTAFPSKFGACIDSFIETGVRQPPCVQGAGHFARAK